MGSLQFQKFNASSIWQDMVTCRQTWYWRRSWGFYVLIYRNQEVKYITGHSLSIGDLKARPHSGTLPPTRPHLLLVPLPVSLREPAFKLPQCLQNQKRQSRHSNGCWAPPSHLDCFRLLSWGWLCSWCGFAMLTGLGQTNGTFQGETLWKSFGFSWESAI